MLLSALREVYMRRAVKYPIIVILAGMLVSVIVPILFRAIHPYNFGRLVGRTTVFAFIAAIVIGWILDRRQKKKKHVDK